MSIFRVPSPLNAGAMQDRSGARGASSNGQTAGADAFVARQPIFDRAQRVVAYELIVRSDGTSHVSAEDVDSAPRSVVSISVHLFGFDELVRGKRAFLRIPPSLLVDQTALLLPPGQVIVGIQHDRAPLGDDVLSACRAMKRAGYVVAVDANANLPSDVNLASFADIVTVDFRATPPSVRREYAESLLPRGIKLMATNVDTREAFSQGVELGYTHLQGYFFCQPEVITRRDIPSYKRSYLRFLQELNQPEIDFDRLEQRTKEDVALSVKLLRYINSAWFGLARDVTSIRQALVLLGANGLRQWATLVAVNSLGEDRPSELLVTGLLRAWFCEHLAPLVGMQDQRSDLFLVGLFSVLDALVGRPLEEVLQEVTVAPSVRGALIGEPTRLHSVFQLALAYERGDWQVVAELAASLSLNVDLLPEVYKRSVRWVSQSVLA